MTTINVTNTPASPEYTWDSAAWSFEDVRAGKTWDTAHDSNHGLTVDETIDIVEFSVRNFSLNKYEAVSVVDVEKPIFSLSKMVSEAFGISETYVDYTSFVIRAFETLNVGEKLGKSVSLPIEDGFAVSDNLGKVTTLRKAESLTVSDLLAKIVTLSKAETFDTKDNLAKTPTLNKGESVTVTDRLAKKTTMQKVEAFAIADAVGRAVKYKRALADGFSITDAIKKSSTISKKESLKIFDEYVRRADATLSDMLLANGDMLMADFQALVSKGAPPGFGKFQEFIHGDYEYRQALFRAIVKAADSTQVSMSDFKLEVDVPDIFDRGAATITDALVGVNVTFSRVFHIVPEIVISMTGGTVIARPELSNKTTNGFTVHLIDGDGNKVAGTISWSAHGY